MSLTTDRNDPGLNDILPSGQQKSYLVMSDEELAKGCVRPVRLTYIHVGIKNEIFSVRLLAEEDDSRRYGYVAFGKYDDSKLPLTGKYLTQREYEDVVAGRKYIGGCGMATTMSRKIAETYAVNPKYYDGTFCTGCGKHLPVDEFVWDGTNETVGS